MSPPQVLILEPLPPDLDAFLAHAAAEFGLSPDQLARCCVLDELRGWRERAVAIATGQPEGPDA